MTASFGDPTPRAILYVHSSDELYGADRILLQLVDHLDRNRYRPVVVIPTDIRYQGLLTKELIQREIKVIHLETAILRRRYFTPSGLALYLWRLLKSTRYLVRVIRSEPIDIVHTNTSAVMPGALAAWLTGTPHVWHVHEIITRPRLLWRLTSWLLPRASARVVAVSGSVRDHLCAGDRLNERKAVVIHNGIDVTRFSAPGSGKPIRDEWSLRPGDVLVGMIGRVSYWKGQDYFLKVASLVARKHPNARFAIVGGTFPEQEELVDKLRASVKELNLDSVMTIAGFRMDVPAVLDAFDIFVLPSTLPDPFPTVVLEAMGASKPVIANAHGGSVELVLNQVTGFLTTPDCPSEMADAIGRLCVEPSERERMGKGGLERVLSCFSLDSFILNWEKLYEEISTAHPILLSFQ